jgi:hypothetical protein
MELNRIITDTVYTTGIRLLAGTKSCIRLHRAQTGFSGPSSRLYDATARGISPKDEWPELEADHSLPSTTEFKNALRCILLFYTSLWHGTKRADILPLLHYYY